MDIGFLSILPVLICFLLILILKNPYISIGAGIITGVIIMLFHSHDFILFDVVFDVLKNESTVKTTIFILFVGAITHAINASGGVKGLIQYLEQKNINTNSKIVAQLLGMLIGILLFIDGTSSMAVTAVISKPLFRKNKISDEKLALITNSTASPIAWIIPFGGAGALTASLLSGINHIGDDAFNYVVKAIPFQFYTICLILLLFISIIFKFEIGGIRKKVVNDQSLEKKEIINEKYLARNMILPIIILLVSIFTQLLITGRGNILKGNTSDAVFYSGIITILLSFILYKYQKNNSKDIIKWFSKGIKNMSIIVLLLVLAYIFSNVLQTVGTTHYLVNILDYIDISFLPIMSLLIAGVISFCTGTSGGTVSILIPLLVPIALTNDINISIIIGAIISGAVFGDQNSVISDSVIMTSSVTGVNAIDHVKTQLPYTLIALGISAILFLII